MTAFRATYSNFVNVKTRGVVQIVFEVPLHDSNAALEILGGMPNPAQERWFGIAPLRSEQPQPRPVHPKPPAGAQREKKKWEEMPKSQQAAICIGEPAFSAYLKEHHPDEWHEAGDADGCLKTILRIVSKTELVTNHKAAALWHQIDTHYHAWKALEHA